MPPRIGLVHDDQRNARERVSAQLHLLLLARTRLIDGGHEEDPGRPLVERRGRQVERPRHERAVVDRRLDQLEHVVLRRSEAPFHDEIAGTLGFRPVGLEQVRGFGMAGRGRRDLLAPVARGIDAARLFVEGGERGGEHVAPELLDRLEFQVETVLLAQPAAERVRADPGLGRGARREVALEELAVGEEREPGAIAGVLDPLGLAREAASQRAHDVVHEGGSAGDDFDRRFDQRSGNPVELWLQALEIGRRRHQPREHRLLPLDERSERPGHQEEHAVERVLGTAHRIAAPALDLVQLDAHRGEPRLEQREVGVQYLRPETAHLARDPRGEIGEPGATRGETLEGLVRKEMVVIVDANRGREDRLVPERDLDELLVQGREALRRFDHVCRSVDTRSLRRQAKAPPGKERVGRISRCG